MWRFSILFMLLAGAQLVPVGAHACSTCHCGDPTLTVHGEEIPYAGRLRPVTQFRYQTEEMGYAGINKQKIEEFRGSFSLAWAPAAWGTFGITVPVVSRNLETVSLATSKATSLGDVDLQGKFFLFQEREASPRHRAGLIVGLRLPTAIEQKNALGVPLSFDVQPGAAALIPRGGAWYGYYRDPFSFYASAVAHWGATHGIQGYEFGTAGTFTMATQYQPAPWLALRLGMDARVSRNDRYYGITDPDSGGFIAFLSPAVSVEFVEDLLGSIEVQIPVIDRLNGAHDENTAVLASLAYDF